MAYRAKKTYHIPDKHRKSYYIPVTHQDRIKFAAVATEKANDVDCIGSNYVFKCPVPECPSMAVVTRRSDGAIHAACPRCKCTYDQQLHPALKPREWEEG
jgi:hypothetical protein